MKQYELGQPDFNGHYPVMLRGHRIGCIRNFGGGLFGSWSLYVTDNNPVFAKDMLVDSGVRSKNRAIKKLIEKYQSNFH